MTQRSFALGSVFGRSGLAYCIDCNRFDHCRTLISVYTHLLRRSATQKNEPEEARCCVKYASYAYAQIPKCLPLE